MRIGHLPINVDRGAVADFCSRRGIRRLSLFGSVLRQDFDPATSDVDVLADFQQGALRGVGLGYFDFGLDLSRILGHRVDFCSKLNRHLRPLVEREMLVIYEGVWCEASHQTEIAKRSPVLLRSTGTRPAATLEKQHRHLADATF
jgi:predicted nucleotidyltransferase